jgi:hypothetical protein
MTNPLNQVNEAIINDPHGSMARHASHWLAVEVMGWEALHRQIAKCWTTGEAVYDTTYYYAADKKVMPMSHWQPLTDANHTRMLVRAMAYLLHPDDQEEAEMTLCIAETVYGTNPYGKDTTHDGLKVLFILAHHKIIKDDTLKGWLSHD